MCGARGTRWDSTNRAGRQSPAPGVALQGWGQQLVGRPWGHGAGTKAVLSPRRPLHLAIIHEQTAVIKQLIDVIVSIPSPQIINITNNLQQVRGFSRRRAEGRVSPIQGWCLHPGAGGCCPLPGLCVRGAGMGPALVTGVPVCRHRCTWPSSPSSPRWCSSCCKPVQTPPCWTATAIPCCTWRSTRATKRW